MAEQSSSTSPWPITLTFGDIPIVLRNADEAGEWAKAERDFWNRIVTGAQGVPTGALQTNANIISSAANKSGDELVAALKNVGANYEPSTGALGLAASRSAAPRQVAIAFEEVTRPGTQNWNLSVENTRALALAAIVRVIGPELGSITRARETEVALRETLAEVDRIRGSDAAEQRRLSDLITQSEEDWKNKLEGYEAKIALAAPKAYWDERARKHSALAQKAARQWFWALLATSGLACFVLIYILVASRPATENVAIELTSGLQRVVVLGTLLAFGVWWLRQKLRDRRAHEHLSDDAAERVTMIETYAAMRAAGLQDANLAPILTALYRPAMSGFAEDTGPVLPLEILLKSVSDTVGKKVS